MKIIASEVQAERIGAERTRGQRGKDYIVFQYVHPSKLTAFAVHVTKTGETIAIA